MITVELDMLQTAGIGALALMVGMYLTRKISILQKCCVPSPVSGGIIFSLLALALYGWFDVEVSFDDTLMKIFMLAFFTCVGFQCDLRVIKQGGKPLLIMLVLLVIMIVLLVEEQIEKAILRLEHGSLESFINLSTRFQIQNLLMALVIIV